VVGREELERQPNLCGNIISKILCWFQNTQNPFAANLTTLLVNIIALVCFIVGASMGMRIAVPKFQDMSQHIFLIMGIMSFQKPK